MKSKIDINELSKGWILRGVKLKTFPSADSEVFPSIEKIHILVNQDCDTPDKAIEQADELWEQLHDNFSQCSIATCRRGVWSEDGFTEVELMLVTINSTFFLGVLPLKEVSSYPDEYLLQHFKTSEDKLPKTQIICWDF